ncbi:MAG: hypothetical protein ABI811_04815 [Acidobacteriota bacterium]
MAGNQRYVGFVGGFGMAVTTEGAGTTMLRTTMPGLAAMVGVQISGETRTHGAQERQAHL